MNQANYNRSLSPLEEFSTDMERMFDSLLGRTVGSVIRGSQTEKFIPHLDVVESANEYLVTIDLPGVKPEDVKLEMEEGKLTISGKRETLKEENTKQVHRVERITGSFHRMITLPREIDTDKIEAKYDQGVLHIILPKSAERQAKKIEIRAAK
jgi:HSP20 family protein